MKGANITNKTRVKLIHLNSIIRKCYWSVLGINGIWKLSFLGKIKCHWPHKVFIGPNSTIEDNVDFWIKHPFDAESFIKIGADVFIGRNSLFNCHTKIIIKNNVLIGANATFADVNHGHKRDDLIKNQELIMESIIVNEDVWLGANVTILKGVIIGQGAIIAAGAVVNKSIPEYEIWGGVPAKKIGERK